MHKRHIKTIAFLLSFLFIFQQSGFTQVAAELNIAGYLATLHNNIVQDKFRPLHLRYLSYDIQANNFKLLLDKGSLKNPNKQFVEDTTKELLKYFFIGVSLPNDSFWVNLRPDSPDNIIDGYLAQTDVGKVMLETDLQLKKDTALFTSPQTPEGKLYWDNLYKKAEELFGRENISIPTLTRPWIVPGEIIIRETQDSAYIYKATLKVMLEQDYLKDSTTYNFTDPRLKALNEYSSQLIRELIIPKLTKEVNTSKRYANLRQVYYSLILAYWFKARFYGKGGLYSSLINKKDLTNSTSKEPWSKTTYFKEYQKSFKDGEYNIQQPVYTPYGQSIRNYFSGGMALALSLQDFGNEFSSPNLSSSPVARVPAAGSPVVRDNEVELNVPGAPSAETLRIQLVSSPKTQAPSAASPPGQPKESIAASPVTRRQVLMASAMGGFLLSLKKSLAFIGDDTIKKVQKLKVAAEKGDIAAVSELMQIAESGNIYASRALDTLNPKAFKTAAEEGKVRAIFTLRDLAFSISTANLVRILFPERRNGEARSSARTGDLLVVSRNPPAIEALRTLNPHALHAAAWNNDGSTIEAFRILINYQNVAAKDFIVMLARQGHRGASRILADICNSLVRDLRNEHLDHGLSGTKLQEELAKKSFENNSNFLYHAFISRENFGELAVMIFKLLQNQASKQGLLAFLQGLDPQELFIKDFLLQAANFNLINQLITTPEALRQVMKIVFRDLATEELETYATRLAIFVEKTSRDKTFLLNKQFQRSLKDLYDVAPDPARKHLLAALLVTYQDELESLDKNELEIIAKENKITLHNFTIDYPKIFHNGTLTVHIVFADKDAVSGHFVLARNFFTQHGYLSKNGSTVDTLTLEKRNVRIVLIKADENKYDIYQRLKEAGIIVSRSHAEAESNVFSQQPQPLSAAGKFFIVSACRSATVIGELSRSYPGADWAGFVSTGEGSKANLLTHYILEELVKPPGQRPRDYRELTSRVTLKDSGLVQEFVLPGSRPLAVQREMSDYFRRAPIQRSSLPQYAQPRENFSSLASLPAVVVGGVAGKVITLAEKNPSLTRRELLTGKVPEDSSASEASAPQAAGSSLIPETQRPGGIDFRTLPIVTQAIGNLSTNISSSAINKLASLNLNKELQDFQRMISLEFTPSAERIREYIQASYLREDSTQDLSKIILCISDILRQEEESLQSTEPELKDILVLLESDISPAELKVIFTGTKS